MGMPTNFGGIAMAVASSPTHEDVPFRPSDAP
jgi:hypothetical protein